MTPAPVILGERNDPHVAAVVTALDSRGRAPVVVTADGLAALAFRLDDDGVLRLDGVPVGGGRGWVRRLASEGWRDGVVVGSRQWAEASAWAELATGWLRTAQVEWLSGWDPLVAAESKVVQHRVARRLGVTVPRTVVANTRAAVVEALGNRVVAKPLGPGDFVAADGRGMLVPSTVVDVRELPEEAVAGAPFLFQEVIAARRHLRVVAVAGQAWTAVLEADGLPVDWRLDEAAHGAFRPGRSEEAEGGTLAMCRRLGVRFASADWIEDRDGRTVFLDLNPAGQWLFLPAAVADAATDALAAWLAAR